jgi:hypothetical protein
MLAHAYGGADPASDCVICGVDVDESCADEVRLKGALRGMTT